MYCKKVRYLSFIRPLIATVVFAIIFSFYNVFPVFAAPTSEINQEKSKLNEINQKQDQNKKFIDRAKKEEQSLQDQIKTIDQKSALIQTQIDALSADIRITSQKRKEKEEELRTISGNIEETAEKFRLASERAEYDQKKLHNRIRNIYKHGEVQYFEVLMSSQSFSDFLNRLAYLQLIAQRDADLLAQIKKTKEDIAIKKLDLETSRDKLSETRNDLLVQEQRIDAIKRSQEEAKDKQKGELSQKNIVFDQVKRNKQKAIEYLEQLEKDEANAIDLIRRLEDKIKSGKGKKFIKGTGQLRWPVNGRVSSDFGWRIHPISRTKRFHKGIDVAAPSGKPVGAADSGIVVYAGSMGGYGSTVIINHGNGMTTLYAHLSAILVSANQSVSAGSVIGKVGDSGYSKGYHLHFEVAVNGERKNPMKYL